MKTNKVIDLIGKEIYVHSINLKHRVTLESPSEKIRALYPEFLEKVGIVKYADDNHFDYEIYYPKLNNSCLLNDIDEIVYTTKDENPEYFI